MSAALPKISIVTINWNNKAGLEKTCASVASQTTDYEWVIIDGGSTDGSVEVIHQFDNYISYWVSEPDKGIYNAMNKGIDAVSGDYVLFLNSGDALVANDVIEKVKKFLLEDPKDFVVGCVICGGKYANQIVPPVEVTGTFLFEKYLSHPASFVKSHLLKKLRFDENYRIASDWIFSVKALMFENASYSPMNICVSDYDLTGVSTRQLWDSFAEKEKACHLSSGETAPEKDLQEPLLPRLGKAVHRREIK